MARLALVLGLAAQLAHLVLEGFGLLRGNGNAFVDGAHFHGMRVAIAEERFQRRRRIVTRGLEILEALAVIAFFAIERAQPDRDLFVFGAARLNAPIERGQGAFGARVTDTQLGFLIAHLLPGGFALGQRFRTELPVGAMLRQHALQRDTRCARTGGVGLRLLDCRKQLGLAALQLFPGALGTAALADARRFVGIGAPQIQLGLLSQRLQAAQV